MSWFLISCQTWNMVHMFGFRCRNQVNQPANQPTSQPASQPTSQPANQPTSQPSQPANQPSSQPANQPSHPTSQPSQPGVGVCFLPCKMAKNRGSLTSCGNTFFFFVNMHKKWRPPIAVNMHEKCKKTQKNEFCCRVVSTCTWPPGVCIVNMHKKCTMGSFSCIFTLGPYGFFFIVNMHKKWTLPIAVNMHTKWKKTQKNEFCCRGVSTF